MKKILAAILLPAMIIIFASQTNPPQGPPPGGPGGRQAKPAPNADSLAAERKKYVDELMASIQGKEKMAADSVFKNIKMFKGMPVERMIGIMNNGWGRALGVNCDGCHNPKDWASEEKEEKQLAREMAGMTQKINADLLKKIPSLEKANVNCNTCHRGKKHP